MIGSIVLDPLGPSSPALEGEVEETETGSESTGTASSGEVSSSSGPDNTASNADATTETSAHSVQASNSSIGSDQIRMQAERLREAYVTSQMLIQPQTLHSLNANVEALSQEGSSLLATDRVLAAYYEVSGTDS